MPKKETKIYPTEQQEAEALADYLRLRKFKFTHIPNETFTRNWGTRMKNKRMGVSSGVPDYLIIIKNFLIFIELKRTKNSNISKPQKEWIEKLNECSGVIAAVCYGFSGAKNFIEDLEKNCKNF